MPRGDQDHWDYQNEVDDIARAAYSPPAPTDAESQFSLRTIFGLMAACACLFAIMRFVPLWLFASVTGAASCIGLWAMWMYDIQHATIRLAWWLLLGIYLFASFLSINGY